MNGPGYKTIESPGERAQISLMYGLQNADSFKGWDVLDTTPVQGITSAFFDWRMMAASVGINREEEIKNSGEAKMIDLLQAKTEQATIGIQEKFSRALEQGNGINLATDIIVPYTSPNNGSLFIDPLPKLVDYTPLTDIVGGINPAVETWWANQTATDASTTYAGFLKVVDKMRNDCSKGPGGPPDLNICDQGTFEFYCAALRSQNRYVEYQKADIPFANVSFYGKPLVWSEYTVNADAGTTVMDTTHGTWYMINTKFFGLQVYSGMNFSSTPFREALNQAGKIAFIQWFGALMVSNRRKQGVIGSIDTTIVA